MWRDVASRGRRGAGRIIILAAFAGVPALLATVAPLPAQQITSYLVGHVDGDETRLGLVGAQVRRGGLGWQPVGSLEAFFLAYEDGAAQRQTLWSVSPGVGMHYAAVNGAFSARASYQFVTGDDDGARFFGGGQSGPAVTVQGLHWGSVPAVEALATYSFPANFVWSQAQAHVPVIAAPPGAISFGGEIVWQGVLDDSETQALMVGPLLRWATGTGIYTLVSGGLKSNVGARDNTWYARAALVFAP